MNLARKYRPKNLKDVLGQTVVVKSLAEALKADRIAPAYLFSGPRGTGKTSCARIFARAAACIADKSEARPCGKCGSCKAYLDGRAIDLLEIDGASHTGVDDVRSIIEGVQYKPNIARKTVYIIDEVHMLSNAAFNALLKTLEEPPPHVLFLFATTEPEKIPSTILSRVQRMQLLRLSLSDLVQNLTMICKEEGLTVNKDVLERVALSSDGCLRDAQTLLEQMLTLSGGKKVDLETVDQFLGTIGTSQEVELLGFLASKDTKKALQRAATYYEEGKDLSKLLSRLVLWTRALLIFKSTQSIDLLKDEFDPEQLQTAAKHFEAWTVEDLDRMHNHFWLGVERMRKSELPRVAFETSIIRASRVVLTEDLNKLVASLENKIAAPAAAPSAPAFTSAPSSYGSAAPQRNTWSKPSAPAPEMAATPIAPISVSNPNDLSAEIKKHRPSLFALLVCAISSEIVKGQYVLAFPKGHFAFRQLSEKILQKELGDLLKKITGGKVTSVVIKEDDSGSAQAAAPKAKPNNYMSEAKKAILSDPLVKQASDLLGAEVESVTIDGIKQS